jgi:hypothetical protein
VHNNYYFLRQLSKELQSSIAGMELAECFSQQKDELIMGFCSSFGQLYIRASLSSELSYLTFPEEFHRARRNSVDLFEELIGCKVQAVVQQLNERSFYIQFDEGSRLLFKMHGNRSNLALFDADGQVTKIFNNSLQNDWDLDLQQLDRPIQQDFEAFVAAGEKVKALFPTFGPLPELYLAQQGFATKSTTQKWELLQQALKLLEQPHYYIIQLDNKPRLSLLPLGNAEAEADNPIEAANKFAVTYSRIYYTEREKQDALKTLQNKKVRTESFIHKNMEKLFDLEENSRFEEMGHILMANLHQISERSEKAELYDFYRDTPIEIKLKKDLSPQKNAEVYYRKAKNQKIELNTLRNNIEAKEKELAAIEKHIAFLESTDNIKEIRKYLKENGLSQDREKEGPAFPFKRFEYDGFEIWVGKNAVNNDELTQKYSFKEDLWLHARDVTGSHVLLKYKAGKPFPQPVIEKAAQLAAYYSKRKTDTLCPVIVTPKKWVRKVKGAPPGAVTIDKETVIMVEPKAF